MRDPVPEVSIAGVPADLVARRASCVLLEELGRPERLQLEASSLDEGMRSGRWNLDRESYLYYSSQVAKWVPARAEPNLCRLAPAEAVAWLWQDWRSARNPKSDAVGRRSLRLNGIPVAILWQGSGEQLAAMVAGPEYQKTQWFDPLLRRPDLGNLRMSLIDSDNTPVFGSQPLSGPATMRAASTTGLPWDAVLVNAALCGNQSALRGAVRGRD